MTLHETWRRVVAMAHRGATSEKIWTALRPHADSAHIEPHTRALRFDGGDLVWSCGGTISFVPRQP